MHREDVEFSSGGVTLRGWLYMPDGAGSHPAVVLAGGWCYVRELVMPHYADAFVEAGIAALIFDYENLGVSDGENRQHLDPWAQIRNYQSALSFLEGRAEIDSDRLGAWGISYSGGHVLILAAIDPRVRTIVSQIPVVDGYRNMRRVHGTMGYRRLWENILDDRRARETDPNARLYIPHATAVPERDLSAWPFPETFTTFAALQASEAPLYENRSTVESVDLLLNYDVIPFVRRVLNTPTMMIVAEGDDLTLWDLEIEAFNALPVFHKELIVLEHTSHMTLYSDRTKLERGSSSCDRLVRKDATHSRLKERMQLENGLGHLTYSTLVHPGDTWPEMKSSLMTYAPAVKQAVSPDQPFAVSLRLSAQSALQLVDDQGERDELRHFLAEESLYLLTANAFPYGPFKGGMVKERVYEPDWTTDERVDYTLAVAEVLADLVPPEISPSIQTAPLAFRPNVTGPDYIARFTHNVHRVVAGLVDLERRTGRTVTLALEPEPWCFLATTAETVEYFEQHLYSANGASVLADLASMSLAQAHGALRRHLGVVFDICHQAVEFEDIPASIQLYAEAGIPIFKLQEAAALWIPEVTADVVAELERYADTIYLTQTAQRRDGELAQFLNIPEAIEAWRKDPNPCEWRIHFHVPIFLEDLGLFKTTRFAIEDALAVHAKEPVSDHLEVETYTWDVLPEHLKDADITTYVTRELDWLTNTLGLTPAGFGG